MTSHDALSFTLVISGAPYSSQAPQSALCFAHALLEAGHTIDRVFLYGDGVLLANKLLTPPSDEVNWQQEWSRWLAEHNVTGIACVASALRRGILDETEQARYGQACANLAPGFTIAGLGEWVDGWVTSDRTVFFQGSAS